ncbi:hypothetical protein CCAX7_59660 [Capsulimonas corticalis]|uniref:Uncharacterized protein n=2 Tax=Capsulimonas corticalis TaxID=2219043 RepID=A0A402CZL2_9BACT|nr:hypothetical protein CCAX7_59660 [Capsulimonas corticalis]
MHHGGAVLDTVFGELWARVDDKNQRVGDGNGCEAISFEVSCDAGILLRATVSVAAADRRIDERVEIGSEDIVCGAAGGEVEEMMILRRPLRYDIAMSMMCCAKDSRIRAWIIGPDPDRSDVAVYLRRKMLRELVRELGWHIAGVWFK